MTQKVHVVSLGCPKARVDTEVMIGLMKGGGYTLAANAEDADAIVVNTCSFLESATEESIDTILEMLQHKAEGRAPQAHRHRLPGPAATAKSLSRS
jgi:ribosomal protein S12 methylthiotransferase